MDWHNRLEVIMDKIKFSLVSQGLDTISAIQHRFQVFKTINLQEAVLDEAGKISNTDFASFLAKIGVFLTTQEYRSIYDVYDPTHSGKISFKEFTDLLRVA